MTTLDETLEYLCSLAHEVGAASVRLSHAQHRRDNAPSGYLTREASGELKLATDEYDAAVAALDKQKAALCCTSNRSG